MPATLLTNINHSTPLVYSNSLPDTLAQTVNRNNKMVGAGAHSDSYTLGYQPSSPLSPRSSTGPSPYAISPQAARSRSSQSKASGRGFRLDLPNYPGTSPRGSTMSPSSTSSTPLITLNRGSQGLAPDTPRLMREKQKELIARAQLSSKLAASPMAIKPDAPRLDPLGSPKGAVTPLALEEAADYFAVARAGKFSPASSPGARSSRSSTGLSKEKR